jgi:hypothetical protein
MPGLEHFDTLQLLALAAALGFASGLRLYAVLFIVGGIGYLGLVELPAGLNVLTHPFVLAASGFMCFVEFFADKIPGVDSLWDVVQTFVRVPAGAALAAGVFGDSSSASMLAAGYSAGRWRRAATSRKPAVGPSSTRRPNRFRTGRRPSARNSRSERCCGSLSRTQWRRWRSLPC